MADSLKLQNAMLSMKCCLCKNVLSVPPIMVLSEDGTQLKCGRCKNNNDKPSICRNFSTENIAQFLLFPCMYKGCNEMIPWEEVESHEDACDKKTIQCPIYYHKCNRIVQVRNLEEHIKRFHERNVHHTPQNITLVRAGESYVGILIHNNHPFITMISDNNYMSKIYVASLRKINTCFTYNLKLSSTKCDDVFVIYENQKIYKYNEMDHCLACMNSQCSLRLYPHTKMRDKIINEDHIKKIPHTVLKPLFVDVSEIRYTITIVPKEEYKDNNKKETSSDTATEQNPKNDVNIVDGCLEKLKRQLQCPVCMEYMIDKIYNCEKGHVLCNNCKIQLTECPSCRAKLEESRNFPLENLADEVVLACLFSKNGCKFTGKLKLLSQHEKECGHEQ